MPFIARRIPRIFLWGPLALAACLLLAGPFAFAQSNWNLEAGSVHFAQITNLRPPLLHESGGKVGFVWGGTSPHSHSGAVDSYYYPLDRDFDRSHTEAWFNDHHPDWVLRRCKNREPAILYKYAWGSYMPLDIGNDSVRAYLWSTYFLPALRRGYRVIALDNVSLRNNAHGCGVLRDGRWTRLYSGAVNDPAYTDTVLDYARWLAHKIHTEGGRLALNAKVDPRDMAATRKLISDGDIWLEEAAFIDGCKGKVTGELWQAKFGLSRETAETKGWVDLDKTCSRLEELTPEDQEWSIANFLLARGAESYFSVIPVGSRIGPLTYPHRFNPPVGTVEGPAQAKGVGWVRRYSHGLVAVNPSVSETMELRLPAGDWRRGTSKIVRGTLTLGPASASILLPMPLAPSEGFFVEPR